MPLADTTLETIEAYWANFFGAPRDGLGAPGARVLAHAELEHYRGIFCMRLGGAALVSVPPAELEAWRGRLGGADVDALSDAAALGALAGAPPERVIGPAALAYADATSLRPLPAPGVRLLGAADEEAYADLRAACAQIEWEHGGSELGLLPLAGKFVRGDLAALAGYELWGERIAHIAIITRPDMRGRGYGAEAVSLLAEDVVSRGLIAQYRTLRANTPSMRIAAGLGFIPFADTVAIRL